MRLRSFVMLTYVAERGPVPQHDLADVFCMDANNLVLLLNELELADFVRRQRDPDDRRRHLVEITDSGRAARARAEAARVAIVDDVLGALYSDDRDTLRALLIKALDS